MSGPGRTVTTWHGAYFDGRSARRHPVTVERTHTGLVIRGESVGELRWPYGEVRCDARATPGEPVRCQRGARDAPEVLVVADPAFRAALEGTTAAGGPLAALRRRSMGALALTAAVVLAALGAVWSIAIPALAAAVAAHLPVQLEEALGESTASMVIGGMRTCSTPAADAALDKMLRRLVADGRGGRYRYDLTIVDDSIVNAFAAPGGRIVVFRGLVAQAQSPEEVAGVLAHEIQHVTQQHGVRSLLRDMPARLLLSSLTGSSVLGDALASAAYTLGSLSYARADELAADLGAVRMLAAARVDPQGMIGFFRRSAAAGEGDSRLASYLSTHPSDSRRVEALEAEVAAAKTAAVPVMTRREWAALRAACGR